MADEITIEFRHHAGNPPNHCQARTTYRGKEVTAAGRNWDEARTNVINLCKQAKSVGQPPASETVDLDPAPVTEKKTIVEEETSTPSPHQAQKLEPIGKV